MVSLFGLTLLLVVSVVAVTAVEADDGLHCYKCKTDATNKTCDDPFTPHKSLIEKCLLKNEKCIKVKHAGGVVRGCGSSFDDEGCTHGGTGLGYQGLVCVCNKDYCNSAHRPASTAYLAVVLLTTAALVGGALL